MEYISYATKNVDKLLKPKLLIAPYFYLSANDVNIDKWLECNIKLFKISSEISKNYSIPLFCQILVSKNILLDDNLIDKIGLIYKDLNCDGFTLWVGGLDEHQATQQELKGYLKLLTYLKVKPVYSMYSGYFSTLLLNKKISLLSGVSHGLEYGESREVYPVGGGIPTSKYYYLPIHKRIDFTNAFYMLGHIGAIDFGVDDFGKSQKYYKEVCDCQQCHKLLNESMKNFIYYESTDFYEVITKRGKIRRKKPSKYTKKICLFHFLLCKNKEFEDSNDIEINDLIDKMRQQHKKYDGCKNINNNEIDHLLKWIKVLEDHLK